MPYRNENYKKCFEIFKKENVWSDDKITFLKNFRKWSLINHPDKIGKNENYSIVSSCKNLIEEDFEKFKKIAKIFTKPKNKTFTKQKNKTSAKPKTSKKIKTSTKPKNKTSTKPKNKTSTKKPCKPTQERNPKTGRCKKTFTKKPCKPTQERNPKTGRCKKISTKNPCKPTQKKNSTTICNMM